MKNFFNLKDEMVPLAEGKVTMAKLKPGMKLNVIHKGGYARQLGINGENVYNGKVQVLGVGIVPYGKRAEKKHVIAKDYKDAQKKYNSIWTHDNIRYGQYWNALDKMNTFFGAISDEESRIKPGWTCWLWKVLDGPNKGIISYCFIGSDDKWEVTFLNKSTPFILET